MIAAVAALLVAGGAHPRYARAADDAERAQAVLSTLATATAKDARLAAAADLAAVAPRVIEPLATFLARPHATTPDQRREVLKAIKASYPDKSGRFSSPGRQKAEQIRADDEFDWLAALAELPASPELSEVFADVAAIRALAGTGQIVAAQHVLDVAFADDTMIYRDECGRYLRRMAPYSLPALIVGSQAGGRKSSQRDKALARYATYQLERMDRQEPGKALAASKGDEDLQIAVLAAFGSTEHREAVGTVFATINDDAPRVRKAARDAWIEYVTGPPPPDPPKKQLVLPGGRVADKETPLWLNSRQLARIELERATDELFGEELAGKADLEQASRRIFAYYDGLRAERDASVYAEGKTKADAGDLAAAIEVFDRLLAEDPARAERTEMAPTYYALAEKMSQEHRYADAAAMFSKAHGLDPDGERADAALARHYLTLGKAQEADGKDGSAAMRRAVELDPSLAQHDERAAQAAGVDTGHKTWMLYAAGAVAVGALALLLVGLRRRG
ncbi:MAG: hypothetical protein H6709_02785 [Kofleriaceae bacterium]|nr:hypothetical protein [Kofleriaceae bacterium]MCB9570993.1 hypothetical protein [Kofleriaceae bacterium]